MISFKCAKCGTITDLPKRPKKFLCPECGVLNTPADEMAGDEACGCILPTGFEWRLPSGEFDTPNGKMYSTADDGTMLTRDEWIAIFKLDPVPAREWMKKAKEGKPGFFKMGGQKMNPVFLGINWQNVLRNFILIMVGVMIAQFTGSAQLPSDMITKQPAPACIDLSNTAPSSAKAIDALNPELGPFKLIETANLGHYSAALVEETQADMDTATEAVKGFLVGDEVAGNGSEPMNLTDYNGTMVWF